MDIQDIITDEIGERIIELTARAWTDYFSDRPGEKIVFTKKQASDMVTLSGLVIQSVFEALGEPSKGN